MIASLPYHISSGESVSVWECHETENLFARVADRQRYRAKPLTVHSAGLVPGKILSPGKASQPDKDITENRILIKGCQDLIISLPPHLKMDRKNMEEIKNLSEDLKRVTENQEKSNEDVLTLYCILEKVQTVLIGVNLT